MCFVFINYINECSWLNLIVCQPRNIISVKWSTLGKNLSESEFTQVVMGAIKFPHKVGSVLLRIFLLWQSLNNAFLHTCTMSCSQYQKKAETNKNGWVQERRHTWTNIWNMHLYSHTVILTDSTKLVKEHCLKITLTCFVFQKFSFLWM